MTRTFRCAVVLCTALLGAAGCGKISSPVVAAHAARHAVPTAPALKKALTGAELRQVRPNEAGVVPILEYHALGPRDASYCRSRKAFRRDLERLYEEGYRPITLQEYLSDRIALPPGKSPVILTFDDSTQEQFRCLPDGSLDPDCALGILRTFAKAHPDFPAHAVFYFLASSAFQQPEFAARKLQSLLDMGCEIGNHTTTHRNLRHLSDSEVQKELATCAMRIHQLAPQARVETMAPPYGFVPHHRALLASGEYGGQRYAYRAVLLAGAEPAPSPVSRAYNPLHVPRIRVFEGRMGSTYWLDRLKRDPQFRYVSDGDPATVTIPRSLAKGVDMSRLTGRTLRTY